MEAWLLGIDPLSAVFVAAFLTVGLPSVLYMGSLRQDLRQLAIACAFIGSTLGVVLARNLLLFLVFWELTVLWACAMILRDRPAGGLTVVYRYFLMHIAAGTSLFFGISIQFANDGSFAMGQVAPAAQPFFLVAFLIKAAVIPMHVWVPLTYPFIHPASAVVLSASATKLGVYGFARFLPGVPWLAYVGAGMALFGVVMALRQKTARQLLSYHLISQVGYMVAGIGVGTELGITGGTLHMWNHVIYKTLLFMVAGAVVFRTGVETLSGIGGRGRWMPLTFVAGVMGAAAISGLPPLNGYVSKTLLTAATEEQAVLQGMLTLAGIGTAFSFSKFIWYLFLDRAPQTGKVATKIREMPPVACLAMASLAAMCLLQGIFYPFFYGLAGHTISVEVFDLPKVWVDALRVGLGVGLYLVFRVAMWSAQLVKTPTSPAAGTPVAGATISGQVPADASLPWDVDVVYAWLSARVLALSQAFAACARDRTQGYLLMITAVLVGLVLFLCW